MSAGEMVYTASEFLGIASGVLFLLVLVGVSIYVPLGLFVAAVLTRMFSEVMW